MSGISHLRRLTAPVSIALCILLIGVAFNMYRTESSQLPILMNTKFKYWTKNPNIDALAPLSWEVVYSKGPNDEAFIRRDTVEEETALGLHVSQDGANDTVDWATIHLKQRLRGEAADKLFNSKVGLRIFPTFTYRYDFETRQPRNVFGLEINNGTHIMWFVFSDIYAGVYAIRNHRIVVIETPVNVWSYRTINLADEFKRAGWEKPNEFFFILILGATKLAPGNYAGFFREIDVTKS